MNIVRFIVIQFHGKSLGPLYDLTWLLCDLFIGDYGLKIPLKPKTKTPKNIIFTRSFKNLWKGRNLSFPVTAEALSCRAAIRGAQGVVKDIGTAAAAKSKGLNALASSSAKNSERDFQSVIETYQLQLPIPLVKLPKPLGIRYEGDFNALSLCDWLGFHIEYNTFHILTGLVRPNAKRETAILSEFWARFRLLKPEHELWDVSDKNGFDLSHTVPILIHGDEGRGRKRAPLLIVAYHSFLGLGTDEANRNRKTKPYLAQKLNYSGNSHTHRMLSAVLPKMSHDEIAFETLVDFIVKDCKRALFEGVTSDQGVTFRAAVIQCCGDWMFLAKIGNFCRSYANCQKQPRGQGSIPKGICHLCRGDQIGYPFEDLRPTARWKETMYDPNDQWFVTVPALLQLPHEPSKPSSFFGFDLWHSFHLGCGKTYAASVLAMISQRMEGSNIDRRFKELTNMYLDYCKETHQSPYVTVITQSSIGWPDTKTFPNGQWSKGHVTTLMFKFIEEFFAVHGIEGDPLFQLCRDTTKHGNNFLRELYQQDIWIKPEDGKRIAESGYSFLMGYMKLAAASFKAGRALFIFMPKIHVVHHIVDNLMWEGLNKPWCMNPLVQAVQVDEDFVGRISRVSRKTHPLQAITRTLQRSLKAAKWHYDSKGYLKGWKRKHESQEGSSTRGDGRKSTHMRKKTIVMRNNSIFMISQNLEKPVFFRNPGSCFETLAFLSGPTFS